MPRVNPLRSLINERNVASRIRLERERRDWTYDGLAKRMTDAGYPIQASAIFKIEKADPPRRVTVDEMVGFSEVFGVPVDDMLVPAALVHDREARAAIETSRVAMRHIREAVDELRQAISNYRAHAQRAVAIQLSDVMETIKNMPEHLKDRPVREMFPTAHEHSDPVQEAIDALVDAVEAVVRDSEDSA